MKVDVLKEFLRFWVAFSVVDEEGVGRVNAEDLKVTIQRVRFLLFVPETLRVKKKRCFTPYAHSGTTLPRMWPMRCSPRRLFTPFVGKKSDTVIDVASLYQMLTIPYR